MPVQFDVVWSTCYSRCILFVSTALSCPVMSCLDVLIKYYHLSLYPRLRVPVPSSCVHRDTSKIPGAIDQPSRIIFSKVGLL